MPIRSAITRIRRSPASCIVIPIGCCSSWFTSARCIAGSAFAAKWLGPARRRLAEVMADLAAVDHVKVIRLHTRVPVAEPGRISAATVAALKVKGAVAWVALHANHARELTEKARAACAAIVDAGIPMVSQSVLLRGVNDDAATLEALMRAFVECRIKPYYLHHGDLAPGTAHLRTTLAHGQELMRGLRGRVSGLCQPDYVLDIPGGHGKSPVGPNYW